MTVDEVALVAGFASTTLFVVSYLPMLYRALRTRDLGSYSRPSLVLANVGNVVQAVYVYSLPVGPIWFLHAFYLFASALMLALHYRHIRPDSAARPPLPTTSPPVGRQTESTIDQGGRHAGDNQRTLQT
jgi:uncharacterized protein with PQ loop repeat